MYAASLSTKTVFKGCLQWKEQKIGFNCCMQQATKKSFCHSKNQGCFMTMLIEVIKRKILTLKTELILFIGVLC